MSPAAIKQCIKRHPFGLYVTECTKKAVYEARLKRMDDRTFIEWLYRKRNPDVPLDLERPQRFSEKLQWLKLHYRDERMIVCSDKALLKDYLVQQGLARYAVPTLALYERGADVDAAALPEAFVLKATHGSGWNVICRGDKEHIRWKWMKRVFDVWLSESLTIFGREWNYQSPAPRIMAEPLLSEQPLPEYKLMCFQGELRAVQVNHALGGKAVVDFYDSEWKLLKNAHIAQYPCSGTPLAKPAAFEEMRAVAKVLSAPFPFVRVDFIQSADRLYVGEMTFFTGAGFYPILPLEYDHEYGRWLTLPEKNHG